MMDVESMTVTGQGAKGEALDLTGDSDDDEAQEHAAGIRRVKHVPSTKAPKINTAAWNQGYHLIGALCFNFSSYGSVLLTQ